MLVFFIRKPFFNLSIFTEEDSTNINNENRKESLEKNATFT